MDNETNLTKENKPNNRKKPKGRKQGTPKGKRKEAPETARPSFTDPAPTGPAPEEEPVADQEAEIWETLGFEGAPERGEKGQEAMEATRQERRRPEPAPKAPPKDLTEREAGELLEEYMEEDVLTRHPSDDDRDEAIDHYMAALETGDPSANSLAGAIFLLEEARLENQAIRNFLANPALEETSVSYKPLLRRDEEETKIPQKAGLLRFLLGTRKYTRKDMLD